MRDLTFTEAYAKADHLKALGDTKVFLRDGAEDLPWDRVSKVEVGSSWRFSGPASCWIFAEIDGVFYQWSVDFEHRDANGKGYSLFERQRLRETVMRMPQPARLQFAEMLSSKVLPDLHKRTEEYRDALNRQWDSEDSVRGLIAFAKNAALAAE